VVRDSKPDFSRPLAGVGFSLGGLPTDDPDHANAGPRGHANAGPPGHANQPGHANFDPGPGPDPGPDPEPDPEPDA